MSNFPALPAGMGWPFVDADTGEFQSVAVKNWLELTNDSRYARQGVDATQRLMALLANETQNANLLFVGDSTGNESTEWIRLLTESLAAQWPAWTVNYRLWNDGTTSYDAAVTVQTGTGSRTLTVYNASIAGAGSATWQGARARAAVYDLSPHPDLIVVSIGHNEQAVSASLWYAQYLSLSESLAWGCPGSDVLLVAQNPATGNTYQQQRREIYREIATRRGYGFVDVCQAFIDTGNPGGLTIDGIHPTPAGSQLWRDTVLGAFTYQQELPPRPLQSSPLLTAGKNLLLNADLSAKTGGVPDNWALTAGATVAIDTVNYETYTVGVPSTGGGAVTSKANKLTGTTAASTLQQYVAVPSQGCWVTWGIRGYVPAGQPLTVGRMGLTATGVSIIQSGSQLGTGAFSWAFVTAYIPAGVNLVRALLYIDSSAGGGNFTLDRQFLTLGKMPVAI